MSSNEVKFILEHEFFIDDESILRCKASNAVAPKFWIRRAVEFFDIDVERSLELRNKKWNRILTAEL